MWKNLDLFLQSLCSIPSSLFFSRPKFFCCSSQDMVRNSMSISSLVLVSMVLNRMLFQEVKVRMTKKLSLSIRKNVTLKKFFKCFWNILLKNSQIFLNWVFRVLRHTPNVLKLQIQFSFPFFWQDITPILLKNAEERHSVQIHNSI